ncbi:MAG: nuclear transport factor 2 family protein [Bacteroidetes bacterium]|nr:nuclear transport factor 2 family protein [Bacteroidota bacterium]
MKTFSLFLMITFLMTGLLSAQDNKDKEAIQSVIQKAYVDGLQNKGPVADIEEGFHPGFELLGNRNNELTKWPIYSWVQYHEKKLAEDPAPPTADKVVSCKFPMIDVTGDAAIAKIELYRDGEKIYTDYLSLYKFDEGWRIVSKIYFSHQKK